MKRRLEDALQDCLEGLAKGRATVEDCLARYSDLAADLEPLLRMGQRVREVYSVEPSVLYAEAARQRFLAALASRRQRALARTLTARPRRAVWRWAPAALGSAALVTFAVWASVLALGSSGGSVSGPEPGDVVVEIVPPTATATPAQQPLVREIAPKAEEHLAAVRSAVEKRAPVEAAAIQGLREVNENLAATLDDPAVSDEDASYIEGLLAEQEELLPGLAELLPPEASEDLEETIRIAGLVRIKLQQRRSPTATVTPEASPTPEETPTATPEAAGTPASPPTSEATPDETSQPSPMTEAEGEPTQEATPTEPTAAP
jgi:hypothetical protein